MRRTTFLTALAFLGWALPAAASSITITAGGPASCLSGGATSSTGPVEFSQNCSFSPSGVGPHTATGQGVAEYGHLGLLLDVIGGPVGFVNAPHSASMTAKFIADGYVIAGPAGLVTTSLNLDLSGALTRAGVGADLVNDVGLSVSTPGGVTAGSVTLLNSGLQTQNFGFNLAGLAAPGGGHLDLTTLPFTVAANTAFSVQVTLTTSGGVNFAPGRVTNDLLNTLTYNIGGPVFNLPAGYTANGLGVVDNLFGAVTAVPEPASLWLMLAGAAGVWRARRRRTSVRPKARRALREEPADD